MCPCICEWKFLGKVAPPSEAPAKLTSNLLKLQSWGAVDIAQWLGVLDTLP